MFTSWYEQQKLTSEAWLQELHRFPEIGYEEIRTANFVAQRLREFGYEVETNIGGTGVVASLRSSRQPEGNCIAFRAELDALPMQEYAEVKYRSENLNNFHGCGHDGHMVTALTAAAYLAKTNDFSGTIRFIFQPAEELLTGARAMLDDGLLDRFPCDEIYAIHNSPDIKAGYVGIPATAALSSADNIDISIRAEGAHGSMPHTGQDAISAAAHLISSVQHAATRIIDAREAGVISFGLLQGGSARNVLPSNVTISGTMRTTRSDVRDRLVDLLRDAAHGTELLFETFIDVVVEPMVSVTLNNESCVQAAINSVRNVVGPERVIENARPLMASEDFSELCKKVPGAYFFIGQGGHPPHHPKFIFDMENIPVGAAIFANIAKNRTIRHPETASDVNG